MLDQIRDEVANARRAGVPFDDIWAAVVERALRGTSRFERDLWRTALAGTEDAWRRAYLGEPPTRCEAAAGRLFSAETEARERLPLAA